MYFQESKSNAKEKPKFTLLIDQLESDESFQLKKRTYMRKFTFMEVWKQAFLRKKTIFINYYNSYFLKET